MSGNLLPLAGKHVLLTGDSHMEWSQFGVKLAAKLKAAGARVTQLAIGGSAAFQWASGKPVCRADGEGKKCISLADIKAAGPYDIAIISLGTNDAANAGKAGGDMTVASRGAIADTKRFADAIGAKQTWWVGPPTMGKNETKQSYVAYYSNRNMEFVYAAGFATFGSFAIDSRPANPGAPDGDGVHVGTKSGEKWAQLVFDKVEAGQTSGTNMNLVLFIGATAATVLLLGRRRG